MTVVQNEPSHPTVIRMYLNDTQFTQNCLALVYYNWTQPTLSLPKTVYHLCYTTTLCLPPVYYNCTLQKPNLPKTVYHLFIITAPYGNLDYPKLFSTCLL